MGLESIGLLRHTVATLAYRAGKVLRDAPPEFATYTGANRTPAKILAHMGDLFDWSLTLADGQQRWHDSTPLAWDAEVARFFRALEAFDQRLRSGIPVEAPLEKLFQGPIADALTHTGQLAMLRRMAGCPMKGENYYKAEMVAGRAGLEQAPPRAEFE